MRKVPTDVRYAFRTFRKAPAFAAAAILTFAIGVGVNTAMFSLINTVLLQPPPFHEPERLAVIYEVEPEMEKAPVTMPDLIDWRERAKSFETIASLQPRYMVFSGGERAERVTSMAVTADFFAMIGVQPALGRAFVPEEAMEGRSNVVILSDEVFRGRFGGDRRILGSAIRADGGTYTVVGVMPPGFRFHTRWQFTPQAWMPMILTRNEDVRGSHDRLAVGRLKPGVSLQQAQVEMSAIASQLEREHPATNGKIGARVVQNQADLTGGISEALFAMLGAVGFVLLIACANVANLLLARGVARRQEMAIRAALGADRSRLMRQMITECLLLAAAGGIAGLAMAFGGVAALRRIESLPIPRLSEIRVDGTVFFYTLIITAIAGLISGLAPALFQSRGDLQTELKQSTGRAVAGSRRASFFRRMLVSAELGLAVILLIGAGLMIRSVGKLLATPLGFRPEGVLTAQISLPEKQYGSEEKTAVFVRSLLGRVRAIPGVTTASVANRIPLKGGPNGTMVVEGDFIPGAEMEGPLVESSIVYPGYFQTMGIALKSGRVFQESDLHKDFKGLIVNEAFVRVLLKNANALGKRISYDKNPPHWQEIIGVVADARQRGLTSPAAPEVYGLAAGPFFTLVVRTQMDPNQLVASVRSQLAAVDPDIPLSEARTMTEVLDESSAGSRNFTRLIGVFAASALILAAIGIYGLMAFAMSQRKQEIGIRMAIGATARNILGLALADAAKVVGAGVGIGVVGAFLLTHFLKSLLYEVSPLDPLTFVAVPAFLAAIAFAASFIPAARATRLDPVGTLREG
jgi:predicted permease